MQVNNLFRNYVVLNNRYKNYFHGAAYITVTLSSFIVTQTPIKHTVSLKISTKHVFIHSLLKEKINQKISIEFILFAHLNYNRIFYFQLLTMQIFTNELRQNNWLKPQGHKSNNAHRIETATLVLFFACTGPRLSKQPYLSQLHCFYCVQHWLELVAA